MKELEKQLTEAQENIQQFQQDIAVRDAADKLNSRMATIASLFELEEDEETIVAAEVKDLDLTDEAFASYLEKVKVVFKHRNKEALAAAAASKEEEKPDEKKEEEEEEKLESKASKKEEEPEEKPQVSIAQALETIEANAAPLLNNLGEDAEGQTLFQRLQKNGLALESKNK